MAKVTTVVVTDDQVRVIREALLDYVNTWNRYSHKEIKDNVKKAQDILLNL